MVEKSIAALRAASPYSAVLTREQFLFYETRTTAKLLCEGMTDTEVVDRITKENLFQYPTEKSIRKMASVCVNRLHTMQDESLIHAVADQPSEIAKQICLYAMMKQYRLVWDFMLTVIGEKYRSRDISFGKIDLNAFFLRLQEQDNGIATWSESTITKIKQVLVRILVDNGYLSCPSANHLELVWLNQILEKAIRDHHDEIVFPAFNYFP